MIKYGRWQNEIHTENGKTIKILEWNEKTDRENVPKFELVPKFEEIV